MQEIHWLHGGFQRRHSATPLQVLNTTGSRPASSNIKQEHTGQVWGHCQAGIERITHDTIKVAAWHSTLLNCKLHIGILADSETEGLSSPQRGSVTQQNTKGVEDAPRKGNLCPFITPNQKPSLTFLFNFTCLEIRVNTGLGSKPLGNCWLQICANLAGSWVQILQSIAKASGFEQGEWAQAPIPGMKLNGLGFPLHCS